MSGEKILIVEDDPISALVAQGLLEKEGYQVVGIASTGEKAVALAMQEHPNVILMDIRLGGKGELDGVQTAQMLNDQLDSPIIYLTDNIGNETLRRSKATKPFAYIFKPFEGKQLFATIETTIYRHKMERKIQESEQWLNAVLNNIGEGVIAVDREQKVTFMNPIAESMTGWIQAEATDTLLDKVLHLIDETTQETLDLFSFLPPEGRASFGERNNLILVNKTGGRIPIEFTIARIKGIQGKMAGSVIAFRDIRERRQAEEEVHRHASRAEALARVASRLSAQLDLNKVLFLVCEEAAHALSVPLTGLILLDRKKDVFDIAATNASDKVYRQFLKQFQPFPRKFYEEFLGANHEPVFVMPDVQTLLAIPNTEIFTQANIRSMAFAVMQQEEEIIGTLNIATTGEIRHFTQDELFFLKGLADQAVIAIKNARLFEQVLAGRERLQILSKKLVEVQETERRFLARELHDQVGQMLTVLQLSLENCKRLSGDELLAGLIESQSVVLTLMSQTRELSMRLRPTMLDDMGLVPTLLWFFDKYSKQFGLPVEFYHTDVEKRLPPELETAVYRIIQEALTNAARHSRANQLRVECISKSGFLNILIQDNGVGFHPEQALAEKKTFGLAGMRERAYLLGGKLEIISTPGNGTQVIARFPLDRPLERRGRERYRIDSR
jgi:PAS domain S-box-containing protein